MNKKESQLPTEESGSEIVKGMSIKIIIVGCVLLVLVPFIFMSGENQDPDPVVTQGTVIEVAESKEVVRTAAGWTTVFKWVCEMQDGSLKTGQSSTIVKEGWILIFHDGKLKKMKLR